MADLIDHEFHRSYLLRLPLPLAQLYSRAHNAKDTRSRHDNCFYVFESLIKLASCPLIGSYIDDLARGKAHNKGIDQALAHLALPSLGQWVAMLRELSQHYGKVAGHPLKYLHRQLTRKHTLAQSPAILALYRRIKHGPDGNLSADTTCNILDLFDRLVRYRNDVVGHGGPRFEEFFEQQMGPLMFPAVNEILAEGVFDPMGMPGTRLVYLTEMRLVEEGKFEVSLRELVGLQGERSAPMIFNEDMASVLSPRFGSFPGLALIWPGRSAPLRLGPMMRFRESEVADEVLMLNRARTGRQVEYLSYTTGRTERDPEMQGAVATILSQVTERRITVEQLAAFEHHSASEADSIEGLTGGGLLDSGNTQMLGDYELLAELGRGGMGVVYLAKQASLGRMVALKTLPSDLASNERALARFRREMRVLGNCDHRNIVKLLDSGTLADGQMYYTMEYVPGADLDQVWRELSDRTAEMGVTDLPDTAFAEALNQASGSKRSDLTTRYERTINPLGRSVDDEGDTITLPPLPLPKLPQALRDANDHRQYIRRVVALIRDAARALHTVHEQGVVHRDVSPGNLMVTPDGMRIVLMDFGLAKGSGVSQAVSMGAGFMGKLRYAAPEQLASAVLDVGPAADVRGLGATMWELITRQRLFEDAHDERTLATHIHQKDVPRLREIDSGFDRDLEAIVVRACEREVPKRIASAGDLADYLQMYLDGDPLPIRPPTTGELVSRWVRQKKALVGSIAFAILTSSLILVLAFSAINQKAEEAIKSKQDAEAAQEKAELAQLESDAARAQAEANLEILRQSLSGLFNTITESGVFRGRGLYGPQRELLDEIVATYEQILGEYGDDPTLYFDLARTMRRLAETNLEVGKVDEAEAQVNDAISYIDRLDNRKPPHQHERALLLVVRARVCLEQKRYYEGIEAADRAVDLLASLLDESDNDELYLKAQASACLVRGDLSLQGQNDFSNALWWYETASAIRWDYFQRDTPRRRIPADELAIVQLKVARAMEADGNPEQARLIYRNIITSILGPFLTDSPSGPSSDDQRITPPMRLRLAVAQRSLANLVADDEQLIILEESVEIIRQLTQDSPDVSDYQIELARSLLALARLDRLTPAERLANAEAATIEIIRREAAFRELQDVVLRHLQEILPTSEVVQNIRIQTQEEWAAFQLMQGAGQGGSSEAPAQSRGHLASQGR